MSVSSALPLLSPLVTRILELSGFPSQLKTRDLLEIFAAYEDENGGYKIKWVDDTTALLIFADAATAKKAYLRTIMSPPDQLINDNGLPAKITPYDKDDASAIISSVSNRQRSRSNAGAVFGSPTKQSAELVAPFSPDSPAKPHKGHAHTSSVGKVFGHRRQQSGSNPNLPPKPVAAALFDAANGGPSPANRVLAGVDNLSGIAGLPANPIAAVVATKNAHEPNRITRNGSNGTSSDGLDTELGKLSLHRNSNTRLATDVPVERLMGPPLSIPANLRPSESGKGGLSARLPNMARSSSTSTSSSVCESTTTTPQSATPVE